MQKAEAIPRIVPGGTPGKYFQALVDLQRRLLAPGGCPWDRAQTHESLRTYLIEEAYEVMDALESKDAEKFAEELGDLLLQVVFHSALAEKRGAFDIRQVIAKIHDKLVRRHPHVFGSAQAKSASEVLKNWEQLKVDERTQEKNHGEKATCSRSILDGVPESLPAALEAYQLTRRAARIGFDWHDIEGLFEKLKEECRELWSLLRAMKNGKVGSRVEEEVGDLLFVAVNIARFLQVDPEIALKKANRKFKKRFQWMEDRARHKGSTLGRMPRAEMESLWEQAKQSL